MEGKELRIKNICERTGLTDRAVRFYIEKGLLSPECYEQNGRTYYDFDEQDILELNAIAVFRRAGFSIEEIHRMQTNPEQISAIIAERGEKLAGQIAQYQETAEKLEAVSALLQHENTGKNYRQTAELLDSISPEHKISKSFLPEEFAPNFGRFDEESAEEKAAEYRKFLGHQYFRDQVGKRWGWFAPVADFFSKIIRKAAAVFILIFLVWFVAVSIPKRVGNLCNFEKEPVVRLYLHETRGFMDSSSAEAVFTADMQEYRQIRDILESTWYFGSIVSVPRKRATSEGFGKQIYLSVLSDNGMTDVVQIMLTESGYFWVYKNDCWCRYFLGMGTRRYEELCEELADFLNRTGT